jgi:outer membrane protein assembly factor BamB
MGGSVEAPAATSTQIRAIADVDGDGADEVLLEWRSNGRDTAVAKGNGARPEIVSWQPLMPRAIQPIAADMHGQGTLTVLAISAVDEVVAVAPPRVANSNPREMWRRPGRGHDAWLDSAKCLSAADLTGNGKHEVVIAGQAPSGKARVSAVNGDGKAIWHVDYDDIHGQRYIFRMGGLTHLWVAHLTDRQRCDVIVSIMRSIMHSDVGYALRGTDGHRLWKQTRAGNTGYGGSGLAFADIDGNGLDEIFCSYPDCYWTADGRTGKVTRFTNPGKVMPNWAAYAIPIVADVNQDGQLEVFHPSNFVWGLLTLDGKRIWSLRGGDVPQVGVLPGLGDVDGNGKIAVGAPFPDGFRCYEAATGKLKWTVKVPTGPYAGTISADVDADGRDEFCFAANTQVVVVEADGEAGNVKWHLSLPGRLSEPCYADVDGDGMGEVLVTCEDGFLYCLD